jgi:hypothetical protein
MRLRWRVVLYLVVATCFAPLVFVLALGVVALPMWGAMLVAKIAQPERFAADEPTWPILLSIIEVLAGVIGTIGLLRALVLLRRTATIRSRKITGLMVATGLAGLSLFNWEVFIPGVFIDDEGGVPWMGLSVYVGLPYFGAACLLYATREQLLGPWKSSANVVPSA